MKKIILAFFLVGSLFANAQVKYGVKAGYVNSQLIERYKDDTESNLYGGKHSFYGGFLVEYRFQPTAAVQAELLYNNIGFHDKSEWTSQNGGTVKNDYKLNLSQISLPLSIKYYANNAFNVSAGMSLGYLVSGKYIVKRDDKTNEQDIFNKDDWYGKPSRFSISPFVGMEYNTPKGIFFDARYNIGLSDLKFWDSDDKGDDKEKINFFQIGVGYKFK